MTSLNTFFTILLISLVLCVGTVSAWQITEYSIDAAAPLLHVAGKAPVTESFTITITSPDRVVSSVTTRAGAGGRYTASLPLTTTRGGTYTIDVYHRRQIVCSMGMKIRTDEIPVSTAPSPISTSSTEVTPIVTPQATPTEIPTLTPDPTPTPDVPAQHAQESSPVHYRGYEIVDGKVVPAGSSSPKDGTPFWVWVLCGVAIVAGGAFILLKE